MDYTSIITFAIVSTITPGPNNGMLMASGLNHGVKSSIPHFLGIITGFPLMVLAVGLGIASIFANYPILNLILKIMGSVYLSFLAYKIATASSLQSSVNSSTPLTYLQAAMFQWINPKAWMMAISAMVTYTVSSETYLYQIVAITSIFFVFGSPCIFLWLWFGNSLQRLIKNLYWLKFFNIFVALLLASTLIPIFLEIYEGLMQ
ncbi:LysE family translocator [OM182 bacterium]|nr:LysE family translocator [OM182 bacterium]